MILEIKIAWVTPKNIFSNGHAPKSDVTAVCQELQKNRIQRIKRQKDIGVRTIAYENVPSTMLDNQRNGVTRKILQRKPSRFKLLTGRLAPGVLLGYFGKCRICRFGI